MPTATWKGHISFGLVSIPIILYSSENSAAKVSFRQIDRRNNARIKYKRVNAETGKEVPWEEVGKGYEYAKDEILPLKKGELEKVAGDNIKTIAIENFISKDEIHFIDIEHTFYLVPDKKGEKGYVILREALMNTNKIGIARVIISTKEHLAAVAVYQNSLVLYTLHYNDEINSLNEFDIPSRNLKEYNVTSKEVDIAEQLIKSMSSKWRPEKYQDEYRHAVEKWVENKLNHLPVSKMKKRGKAAAAGHKVNFIDLLRKSLVNKKPSAKKSASKKTKKVIAPPRATKSKPSRHVTRH